MDALKKFGELSRIDLFSCSPDFREYHILTYARWAWNNSLLLKKKTVWQVGHACVKTKQKRYENGLYHCSWFTFFFSSSIGRNSCKGCHLNIELNDKNEMCFWSSVKDLCYKLRAFAYRKIEKFSSLSINYSSSFHWSNVTFVTGVLSNVNDLSSTIKNGIQL